MGRSWEWRGRKLKGKAGAGPVGPDGTRRFGFYPEIDEPELVVSKGGAWLGGRAPGGGKRGCGLVQGAGGEGGPDHVQGSGMAGQAQPRR